MKKHTFSVEDPIWVLNCPTRFRSTCNTYGVHEGATVWCFPFDLTGKAHSLVQPRVTAVSSIVDNPGMEILTTYPEVMSFCFTRYASDEVIADADAQTTSYGQNPGNTETEFSQKLWMKAFKCGNVYFERQLTSIFVEGLLLSIRAKVRNYLIMHPRTAYTEIVRFAESEENTHRPTK